MNERNKTMGESKIKAKKASLRDFQDFLTDLDQGSVHAELSRQLPKLVAAVKDTNKAGALTLVISVKPDRGSTVLVEGKVTPRMPTRRGSATVFFVDDDGNATTSDGRQLELETVVKTKVMEGASKTKKKFEGDDDGGDENEGSDEE